MKTVKSSKKSRWSAFQGNEFILPDPESPPAAVVTKGLASTVVRPDASSGDYPQLRIRLRDREQDFQADFARRDVATLFGKSEKTINNWIARGQVSFHRWPSGELYFTPQDLEDIITGGRQLAGGSQ